MPSNDRIANRSSRPTQPPLVLTRLVTRVMSPEDILDELLSVHNPRTNSSKTPKKQKKDPVKRQSKSNRRPRTPIIAPDQREVLRMLESGLNITQISELRGTSRQAASKLAQRAQNNAAAIKDAANKILAERSGGYDRRTVQLRSDPAAKQPPKACEE